MDYNKTGALIAQARKNKNLRQQDLADLLGVTSAAVSKWERGKGFPDVSIVQLLCSELDISLEELFLGERLETSRSDKEDLAQEIISTIDSQKEKEKRTNNLIIILSLIVAYLFISYVTDLWDVMCLLLIVYVCFQMNINRSGGYSNRNNVIFFLVFIALTINETIMKVIGPVFYVKFFPGFTLWKYIPDFWFAALIYVCCTIWINLSHHSSKDEEKKIEIS